MAAWPYNTARWQKLREVQLTDEPFCRQCRAFGRLRPASVGDHIIPVRHAPERAFDQSNLQSLCARCHNSIKQREERQGYSDQVGDDGLPVDPRHPANAAGVSAKVQGLRR